MNVDRLFGSFCASSAEMCATNGPPTALRAPSFAQTIIRTTAFDARGDDVSMSAARPPLVTARRAICRLSRPDMKTLANFIGAGVVSQCENEVVILAVTALGCELIAAVNVSFRNECSTPHCEEKDDNC